MKVLIVSWLDPRLRSVSSIHKWGAAGQSLGHDVAVFGEANPELPQIKFTTDLDGVDLALFVIQVSSDFPDMPMLARVIDRIPRDRRIVVDLWGRFNDTIRLEHDFNHLEKIDGHLGWEWIEAFQATTATVTQPTLAPLRADVKPFLFHGYDQASLAKPYSSAREAADAWREAKKPYGVMYAGNNWQRWDQVRQFLEQYRPVRSEIGKACLVGWDWAARPEWAVKNGVMGVDTDPALLADLGVELRDSVRFDEVVPLLGQARFAPVFHRPLFRHLGYVTIRTFETFYADTLPVLMLPRDFVEAIYGSAALTLVPAGDAGAHMQDALRRPEAYWEAVLATRAHLAKHHSYKVRYEELGQLMGQRTTRATAP